MKKGKRGKYEKTSGRHFLKQAAVGAGIATTGISFPGLMLRAARAGTKQPIKVGLLTTMSGSWSTWGTVHWRGFELGVNEVNAAGGVLGRPIEVIKVDTTSDPRRGVEAATRLIQQEKVDFIAGTFSSSERNAVGQVITDLDKILVAAVSFEGQLWKFHPGVCNRNVFFTCEEASQEIWPHLPYMTQNHGKKFFLIGSDYAWPQGVFEVLKMKLPEFGASVVGTKFMPFNTPNFDSVLREIRDSGADIVFNCLVGPDGVNFNRQFHGAGMNRDHTFWTIDDEEFMTMQIGPAASAGHYVSFGWFVVVDTPGSKAFVKRWKAAYGKDAVTTTTGLTMYTAAHMSAEALKKSGEVSTDALRSGLEGLSWDAPNGTVTIRKEDHQLITSSYLVRTNENWTSAEDMFTVIQGFQSVEPRKTDCQNLPLSQ